jgi:beta-xylosidase
LRVLGAITQHVENRNLNLNVTKNIRGSSPQQKQIEPVKVDTTLEELVAIEARLKNLQIEESEIIDGETTEEIGEVHTDRHDVNVECEVEYEPTSPHGESFNPERD